MKKGMYNDLHIIRISEGTMIRHHKGVGTKEQKS